MYMGVPFPTNHAENDSKIRQSSKEPSSRSSLAPAARSTSLNTLRGCNNHSKRAFTRKGEKVQQKTFRLITIRSSNSQPPQ